MGNIYINISFAKLQGDANFQADLQKYITAALYFVMKLNLHSYKHLHTWV